MKNTSNILLLIFWSFLCLAFFSLDLILGSVHISLSEIREIFSGAAEDTGLWHILYNFRLPKAITALLTGSALAVAGLYMQTLFQNPLAGPYVLGISSGASLGVALLLMGGAFLPTAIVASTWAQVGAAIIGSLLVLLLVLGVSSRVNDTVSLLIVGMMFGSIAGSVVNVLQSASNAESLKLFVMWSMGSLSSVTWQFLNVMAPIIIICLILSLFLPKKLNALLLGERYARGLGVSIGGIKITVIILCCLLAGTATAFTGPIAFIGMAVPHIVRGMFRTSDHRIVLPACIIVGASLLTLCDIISQVPWSDTTLPINSVSSLIGAPIILWVIFKNKHLHS